MSFVQRAKDKLKKEYESYKYNKELENKPEIVRNKLERARAEQREQIQVMKEQQQFEREKQELKTLQRQNSTVGRFGSALKSHLDNVKASQQQPRGQLKAKQNATLGTGRNIIYDQKPTNNFTTFNEQPKGSKSLILSDEKSKSSVFGHSGGVVGNRQQVKPKKKPQGKTIVIKL